MTLNSLVFIPFFAIIFLTLLCIQFIGKKVNKSVNKIQCVILLFSSLIFIALNNYIYCFIILINSLITFYAGIKITTSNNKKKYLCLTIILFIIELLFFKYTNFFISNICSLIKEDPILLNILLPLGISFYIFTEIGYLIDIYRGKYKADSNFINVALMLSYFPKVISGPIVRGNDFLPQLNNYKGISINESLVGIQIFVIGLFKKIVLADHLGVFVNDIFNSPHSFDTITIILAVVSYSLQIYFDFSGYSDMAIGTSKILGINLKPNFIFPYFAKNPSQFWERWHVSLSSWLREYIYFPLGGNRKGKSRTYFNLLIVMLISGIWHGAGWTFIVWGLLHGIYSCIYKLVSKYINTNNKYLNILYITINFFVVSLLWVFFRANSFNNALEIFKGCFTIHDGINQPFTWSFFAIILVLLSALTIKLKNKKIELFETNDLYIILNLNKISSQVIFIVFIGITIIMGYYGNTAFIYGKF